MDVGDVVVRVVAKDDNYTAFMTRARREAQALGDAVDKAGHGTASSMQAASASIRLLEGDMTRNVRAVERFITTIPGVGKALQDIFPLVGVAATIGIIARIGEEIYKTANELRQIKNVANESFLAMNAGAQKNADSLRVANDKLEEQIALMEHKPINGLALVLDEARLRADELAISLNNDYETFKKITEESQKGIWAKLLMQGVDTQLGNNLNNQLANIRTLGRQQKDQLRNGDQAGAVDTANKLRAAQDAAIAFADAELKYSKKYTTGVNADALNSFKDLATNQEDVSDQGTRNIRDQRDLKLDEQKNKELEAAKRAQALLLKQDEEEEKAQNAFNKLTINEELKFWNDRISAFTKGGEQYIAVQDKIYDLIAKRPSLISESKKNQAEAGKFQVEGTDLVNAGNVALQKMITEQAERSAKATAAYNNEVAKGTMEQEKAASAFAESSIKMAVLQGTMSGLDAAQALAAVHAHDHAAELSLVNQQLAEQIRLINAMPADKMSDEDKANEIRSATQKAAFETSGINSTYAITQQNDQQAVSSQQLAPAMQETLGRIANDWTNMTQSIIQVTTRAMDSLNDDFVKFATGQGKSGDFGKTFMQAGQGLLKTAFQSYEGNVMKALGLGGAKKPTGAQGDPLYTVSATSGGGSPLASSLFRPFFGGQQQSLGQGQGMPQQAGGGSIWSRLAGAFLPGLVKGMGGSFGGGDNFSTDSFGMPQGFQGGFAGGGDVTANHPMLVGENGPEILTPRLPGRVIPNAQLGGGDTSIHVDARGSTDPAAVHAAVMRAAPAIISASLQAHHQSDKRMGRRR